MIPLQCLVVAIYILTLSSIGNSSRIRRAGVAGYDPYGLTNAFSDMDKPKRREYRTLLRKRFQDDDDSYFNPGTGLDIDPIEYMRASPYTGYLSNYHYESPSQSYETLAQYPLPYSDYVQRDYGPHKRMALNPRRMVPTVEELRTIFGEADVPMKRFAPVKRQEPENGNMESIQTEENTNEGIDPVKEQAAFDWGKLINAAEQLTKEKQNTNTVVENSEQEDSKGDDLEEAFNDSDIDDNNAQLYENDNEDELPNYASESEMPTEDILEVDRAQNKAKRASSVGDSSDYVLGLLKEISDLKQRISTEEMLRMLQGRENDFLANALKYATMDQLHESDTFVANEYKDISKATEAEELIEQLTEELEEDDSLEDEDDTDLEDITEPEIKRSEGVPNYEEDEWLETPVKEKVGLGALLEDDDGDEEEDAMEDFIGSEPSLDIPYLEDESDNDESEAAMETIAEEIANEQNEEKNKQEEAILLAKLINSVSPGTLQHIINDLVGQETEAIENAECPAVLELSQNCAFADAKGIPIDVDARDLCIRHQMCYTCGVALGIPATRCDEGYKGTVIAECGNDVNCIRTAAYFLQLMTSRYHKYEEYSPRECSNACVADFIYGVE